MPDLEFVWRSEALTSPTAPVVGGGVLYFAAAGENGGSRLTGLDAKTGAPLFTTSEGLEWAQISGDLSLANGHLCFTTTTGDLYCFGLPLEI